MGLFGGTTINSYSPPPINVGQANADAKSMTQATPEELALLAKLGISAQEADANVLAEMRALRARGDDLATLDTDYMNRAYQPSYERLMNDYKLQDQAILEDMNKRGIISVPGGMSEPEVYTRNLLGRETKEALGRNMLEAQNQAVQQKLAQYQARLGETNQANTRWGQTMDPLIKSTVVPESERQANTVGAAGNIYNARLGYASNMGNLGNQQKLAQMGNQMNTIGGGMGVVSSLIGTLASERSMKKNIEPGPDPEQDLNEMRDVPVDRWQYRWEDDNAPMHEGAMADSVPEDAQAPGGIDVASYMGKLTNAVKALDKKVGAFERMMQQGGEPNGL